MQKLNKPLVGTGFIQKSCKRIVSRAQSSGILSSEVIFQFVKSSRIVCLVKSLIAGDHKHILYLHIVCDFTTPCNKLSITTIENRL